jgi:hypothetical protein
VTSTESINNLFKQRMLSWRGNVPHVQEGCRATECSLENLTERKWPLDGWISSWFVHCK